MAFHAIGTAALESLGISSLEVHTCSRGFELVDPQFPTRISQTYTTALEAVSEAMEGARPAEVPE